MEVIYQGMDRMTEEQPASPLDEFEMSLLEYPWDEALDVRAHASPTAENHVEASKRIPSGYFDPASALIIGEFVDSDDYSILASKNGAEEASDHAVMYNENQECIEMYPLVATGGNSILVPAASEAFYGSIIRQKDQEYIEIATTVPTTLFTIVEEEENSIISDVSIQHFRPVPFQKTLGSSSKSHLGISRRVQDSFSSSNKRNKKRWCLLKKARQNFWLQRKSTTAAEEEAKTYSTFGGNAHGMPFYSVQSILNDLETQSLLSDKSGGKTKEVGPEIKGKRAWLRFIQKVRILARNCKDPDEDGTPKNEAVKLGTTQNQYRLRFSGQRHSSAEVSDKAPEGKTLLSHSNPTNALYRTRVRERRSKNEKQQPEQSGPSVEQSHQVIANKAEAMICPEVKSVTRIVVVRQTHLNGSERSDRSSSVGSARVTQFDCEGNRDDSRNQFRTEFAVKDFQPYSFGYDMLTLLSDTLIDMTNTIGGKIDLACCAGKERIERREGASLILVGSSETVGDLTETSHEILINKIKANEEETKHGK